MGCKNQLPVMKRSQLIGECGKFNCHECMNKAFALHPFVFIRVFMSSHKCSKDEIIFTTPMGYHYYSMQY